MSRTADVREDVAEIVDDHRKTFEVIADGTDKPAEWAQQWLREADRDE